MRSTRHGSVVLDLATAEETTSRDDDEDDDPREPELELQLAGPTGSSGSPPAPSIASGPLRMQGSRLWLARYWDQEALVARELLTRSADVPDDLDLPSSRPGCNGCSRKDDDRDQQLASAVCALSRVSVLAGGPGTGKTTTVSRLLALLREQHPTCRIALAAPTGKAAARLGGGGPVVDGEPCRRRTRPGWASCRPMTLHRLLGWRPGQARGSSTTPATGSRTRSWWWTRPRWCR